MRGSRYLLFLLWLAALGRPEILDRVAVTAGKCVITQSDILRDIRLSSLFNQTEPDFSSDARRKTAERLVERALIDNEMEIGRYPSPQPPEIEAALAALKKERFPTGDAYRKALSRYGVRDEDVRLYLLQQLAVSRFIDARFGPAVQLLEADARDYYSSTFRPKWENKEGKPAPPFDEVRAEIEEILRSERADKLLDEWLKEAKSRTLIEFKSEAFQ